MSVAAPPPSKIQNPHPTPPVPPPLLYRPAQYRPYLLFLFHLQIPHHQASRQDLATRPSAACTIELFILVRSDAHGPGEGRLVVCWKGVCKAVEGVGVPGEGKAADKVSAEEPDNKRQFQNRLSQRAHCRRKEYLQTLEERIRQYEADEIHSNVLMQEVARALKEDKEPLKKEVVALKLQLVDRAVEHSWEDDRPVLEEQIRWLGEEVEVLRKQGRHAVENSEREMVEEKVPAEDQALIKRAILAADCQTRDSGGRAGLKHFKFDWSCPAKYAADAPVVRLTGGAGPTGLPNAWFSQLDDALFKAGDPDRRKLMDKHTNDFDDYADEQWAPRAVKRYREKMKEPVPFKPGSYDWLAHGSHTLSKTSKSIAKSL